MVGIQISHNAPGRVAGVPDGSELHYEEHAAGSLNCWCRPLVEPLVIDDQGHITPMRRG
jgi:hypothetical protein